MSDFDTVLERLVADPAFAAALAADPASALAGYRLEPDEVELLHSQVGAAAPAQRGVETRANQSSLFGMLSPLAGLVGELGHGGGAGFGPADGAGGQGGGSGRGAGPVPAQGLGPAVEQGFGSAAEQGFGSAAEQGFGVASGPVEGLGPASTQFEHLAAATEGGQGLGPAGPTEGFGAAHPTGVGRLDEAGAAPAGETIERFESTTYASQAFGTAQSGGPLAAYGQALNPAGTPDPVITFGAGHGGQLAGIGDQAARLEQLPTLPDGYRTRVDVDGDGQWDDHILRARSDGGVDILVDVDNDGRVDFIGHDDNADGRVDSAEYDTDGDGRVDTRMHDDDGDGWLDRTERIPPPRN